MQMSSAWISAAMIILFLMVILSQPPRHPCHFRRL
jgi:hypothetical protein